MKYLIDYFKFVLKPCPGSLLTIHDIFRLLHLSDISDKFESYGSRYHYRNCFSYNNIIRIYESAPERVHDMGYMVELSGEGCRFMEENFKKRYKKDFMWKKFIEKVTDFTKKNVKLNVARIDLAFDDFDGLLCMETIEKSLKNREYVSLFRTPAYVEDYFPEIDPTCPEWSQIKELSGRNPGHTIYVGSRRSNAFCRFYDKRAERIARAKTDEQREEYTKIKHWVRFELEAKNRTANSIVEAMNKLDEAEFSEYLSQVINGYLRFIDRDDTNVTRCTVKQWWADFLGTAERSSLTCPGIPKDPVAGAVAWLNHSLAPTLYALSQRFGKEQLFSLIDSCPPERLTAKHRDIMESTQHKTLEFTSAELWASYLPDVVYLYLQEKERLNAS